MKPPYNDVWSRIKSLWYHVGSYDLPIEHSQNDFTQIQIPIKYMKRHICAINAMALYEGSRRIIYEKEIMEDM